MHRKSRSESARKTAAASSAASKRTNSKAKTTINPMIYRHLLENVVDESLLSSETGDETTVEGTSGQFEPPNYSWVQMSLPGGGVVSVPLQEDIPRSVESSSDVSSLVVQNSQVRPTSPKSTSESGALEPVTHFNLDQLLEIVQSFRLDTSLASHDVNSLVTQRELTATPVGQQKTLGSQNKEQTSSRLVKKVQKSTQNVKDHKKYKKSNNMSYNKSREPDSDHYGSYGEIIRQNEVVSSSEVQIRDTHSCPSSPTETECSSGFSTLRRRSVTLTEKIRTSHDGSKTQVVRQYGCNTSSNDTPPNVSYQQNAFIYINAEDEQAMASQGNGRFNSLSFPSLIHQTSATDISSSGHHTTTLPRFQWDSTKSSVNDTTIANQGSQIVCMNSIEPNTVMFCTNDYSVLSDITVPEIIDELESQFEDNLCQLQGVRLVGSMVYICLSHRDSIQHLSTYGFYIRGVPIKVIDITHDSIVICLTGVPHYITDSTISMLISTFGISIGEVERRFYKGIDTGERFVRLMPRRRTQIPDFVTVGGCKILIRLLKVDEVTQPYMLQSSTLAQQKCDVIQLKTKDKNLNTISSPAGNRRVKPGHCNGSISSPNDIQMPPPMNLESTSHGASVGGKDSSILNSIESPKIAKSFRNRPTKIDDTKSDTQQVISSSVSSGNYLSAETIDLPNISPPPYKTPNTSESGGSASNSRQGTLSRHGSDDVSNGVTSNGTSRSTTLKHNKSSSKKSLAYPRKLDSNNSITGFSSSGSPIVPYKNSTEEDNNKRTNSVAFEEPSIGGGGFIFRRPTSSKTVNGILRKSSNNVDDATLSITIAKATEAATSSLKRSRRSNHRKTSSSKSRSSSRKASEQGGSTNSADSGESSGGGERGETPPRNSKSRSKKSENTSKDKIKKKGAKDLALTKDLPWCGCWGNGCL